MDYLDLIYALAERLPRSEEYNLKSQMTRAATSVALNIAEGSTSQSDPEQARFLSMAIRSALETVACQHIIRRRRLLEDTSLLDQGYRQAEVLTAKLHTMRKSLMPEIAAVREEAIPYTIDSA